jgi:two-component system, NarL family, sensor histidine kinase LiaS
MFARFGLRFRMATSYVVVSAAAVLLVETILLVIFIPQIRSAQDDAKAAAHEATQALAGQAQAKAESIAQGIAASAGTFATTAAARQPGLSDAKLLAAAARQVSLPAPPAGSGRDDGLRDSGQVAMALATVDGRIVATKGMTGPSLPPYAVAVAGDSGLKTVDGRVIAWSTRPVTVSDSAGKPAAQAPRAIGLVYEEFQAPQPDPASLVNADGSADTTPAQTGQGLLGLLTPGALVLILLIPVGALFGLLSTGKLIRRIRRLASGTEAMAEGDLRSRIPVSGGDEVGQLELAFNSMAERLELALQAERDAAGSEARRAERTRIARELHDSISQDLFSASLVAGGLRKALPADTKLWRQAESMELVLERTRREMRVMLMELRPAALEDAGLTAALNEMCRAYEVRVGIPITARIEPPNLTPAVEHAVLRVIQEALGNAVRHGNPATIEIDVHSIEAHGNGAHGNGAHGEGHNVSVTVRDDGTGFDLARAPERHGMGLELIRERVEELGGSVQVDTAPLRGTTVRVTM